MIKKEYTKPAMQVVIINNSPQILAGSLNSINSTGLDDSEQLLLDDVGLSGGIWDNAW